MKYAIREITLGKFHQKVAFKSLQIRFRTGVPFVQIHKKNFSPDKLEETQTLFIIILLRIRCMFFENFCFQSMMGIFFFFLWEAIIWKTCRLKQISKWEINLIKKFRAGVQSFYRYEFRQSFKNCLDSYLLCKNEIVAAAHYYLHCSNENNNNDSAVQY